MITTSERVSVHGGHSGQFCGHASGTLEEVVEAYIAAGFAWVGISEHMPPAADRFLYPEERQAGENAVSLRRRFAAYIEQCRQLQQKSADRLCLYVAMETEYYSGSVRLVRDLAAEFEPDYLVGSIHHVDDVPFDYSPREYQRAADRLGGLDRLYCRYFDQQYAMLQSLHPAVVGHFDIIRIYDPHYRDRLRHKEIARRIERNLDYIAHHRMILDFNLRALAKGADEPYVSAAILAAARERNIAAVPGDDSHGPETIGNHMDTAIDLLHQAGFSLDWQRPVSERA